MPEAMFIEQLENVILIILSFSLGLNISKFDINLHLFRRINKLILGFLLSIIIASVSIFKTNYLYNVAVATMTSAFFVNVWIKKGMTSIKRTTITTYSYLFFVLLIIILGLTSVNWATVDGKFFLQNLLIFVLQIITLSYLLIWINNKLFSKTVYLSIPFSLFSSFFIFSVSQNLFIYTGILSVIWFSFVTRNSIFSSPYRKNLTSLFRNKWFILSYILITIFISWKQLYLSLNLSQTLIGIGVTILIISLKRISQPILFWNDNTLVVCIGILVVTQFIIKNNMDSRSFYIILNSASGILLVEVFLMFRKNSLFKESYYVDEKCHESKLFYNSKSLLFEDYLSNPNGSILQDFSYAGFNYSESIIDTNNLNEYNVTNFGVKPDLNVDQTEQIQQVINKIGKIGGGIIFFPKGVYHLNWAKNKVQYIEINYSNIVLKGEFVGQERKTTFVSHKPTLEGSKNPWLSPFLITFGTELQQPNLFWGLQFKNRKYIRTQSNSLTDPGSDGNIQSPAFCCSIIKDSMRGEKSIFVKNTDLLSEAKFILIAMHNTTKDGNLIKELLNRNYLRTEWKTALRAGPEKAPSFQWLVEIDQILSNNEIVLKQPLRRDILLKYEPEIYVATMIQNVGIVDLNFRSTWNGVFRHHGAPLYFSKKQSQIMDYGWNAINFCRVAHGFMRNVSIKNFTNSIYLQDSRNVTIEDTTVKGHDGHQGIKLYGHSCDNLMQNITFFNHYADMIGGEGNCYGNVFLRVKYANPENRAVDFDFHGFSEGPFSPPSYTLFDNCSGFRGIKASGTLYNQPACALNNVWWNIKSEGYEASTEIFKHDQYKTKSLIRRNLSAFYMALIFILQHNKKNIKTLSKAYIKKKAEINQTQLLRSNHYKLFKNSIIAGYQNNYDLTIGNHSTTFSNTYIHIESLNQGINLPKSLFEFQVENRLKKLKE